MIVVGKFIYTAFNDIASRERLNEWYNIQLQNGKPIYYLLPSNKWYQSARKQQPGLAFQNFDDLAILMLQASDVHFTSITEEDRMFFFYEIIQKEGHFLSETELLQKARAYADTYGQLKRLGLAVGETPSPLTDLVPMFKEYEEKYLGEKGLYDPENRILKSIEYSKGLSTFPLCHVVIDGYMDFSPVQYKMLQYLQSASIPFTIYLPALDTPLVLKTASTLLQIGAETNEEKVLTLPVLCENQQLASATTVEEEINGVLNTIDHLKGNGRYDQFAIVLTDEDGYSNTLQQKSRQMLIPLKQARKKQLNELNLLELLKITIDKPVLDSKWEQIPIVDTAAKLCFLESNEFTKVKERYIYHEEISDVHVKDIVEKVIEFQDSIPETHSLSFYQKETLHLLEQLPLQTIWKQQIKNKTQPQLKNIAFELRAFQLVKELIKNTLDEKELFPISNITVHYETYKKWLLNQLEEKSLYVDRAPKDGIELYSFRDLPLFRGKHVFILGMNEGTFPKQMKLSGYFQERYIEGIPSPYPFPTPDYFRAKDDASFSQLPYLSESLSFSYVEGMNPNQPLLPSKYVADFTNTKRYSTILRMEEDEYQSENEKLEKLAYHAGKGMKLKETPKQLQNYQEYLSYLEKGTELIADKWWDQLSTKKVPITKLERYAECAFKYGMGDVLNVEAPLEKQQRINALEAGNMLHRIIEKFYGIAKGVPFNQLTSFFENNAETRLLTIFEEEWQELVAKHFELQRRTLDKEKTGWERKLIKWLTAERMYFWENEKLSDMTIFHLEERVGLTIELPGGEAVVLSGKIDRMDIDEHGFVIYDYKSSNKEWSFDKDVPVGKMIQIPLYMIAIEEEFKYGSLKDHPFRNSKAVGGGYISIKNPQIRKKNMVWKNEEQQERFGPKTKTTNILNLKREDLMESYQLASLIERLWIGTASNFSVNPLSASSCKFCDYKSVCRVTREQMEEGMGENGF